MSSSKSDKAWEGTNLSSSAWIEFIQSDFWKAILFDLDAREQYLLQLFKDSDKEWPPEVIKGKMTEIDYFRQMPILILASIEDKIQTNKEISHDSEDGRSTNGVA